jgi:hypothetical protein
MGGFLACFADLTDPRTGNAARHDLLEMLVIALCSVLTGGEDCTDMAEFAASKVDFLRGFLKLKHGAPSHDTFSRLFRLLDPDQFRACFQRFSMRIRLALPSILRPRLGLNARQLSGGMGPPEIIQQAIWLYLRFTLSLRDVEDLLAEHGIAVSYETVRRWGKT